MTNESKNQNIPESTTDSPLSRERTPFSKKRGYILVTVGVLILVTAALSLFTSPKNSSRSVAPSPTITQTPEVTTIPTRSQATAPTLTKQEQTNLETQVQSQLREIVTITYTIAKTQEYGQDWAVVQIANDTTDPANVVVHKENGVWNVKLGPGTFFEAEELQTIGAPEQLIEDINGGI